MTLDHLILRYAHIAMGMLALLSGAAAMAPLTHVLRVLHRDRIVLLRPGEALPCRAVRESGLLAIPALLPLGLLLYWVIRVRVLPLIKKAWTPRFVSQTS